MTWFNIFYFGVLILVLLSGIYPMYLSKTARSTRELSKLNKIFRMFNQGQTPEKTLEQIQAVKWKYNLRHVDVLQDFCQAIINHTQKNGRS